MNQSFLEASARQRIDGLLDSNSFVEFVPPEERVVSPHLKQVEALQSFDDGITVGRGLLRGHPILIASQEGRYMGGAVGEVHGAKLTGLLERAIDDKPSAVILMIDSGGVRLQEANAGLIAISEVIRSLLAVRNQEILTLALIGGKIGCFGGMGIVSRCCDVVIMSDESRLGLSGPEVIETLHGVEEFDSHDQRLIWQTMGGKHRYLLGEADRLVEDDIKAFRDMVVDCLNMGSKLTLESMEQEHKQLEDRLKKFGSKLCAADIWLSFGIQNVNQLPLLSIDDFLKIIDKKIVK